MSTLIMSRLLHLDDVAMQCEYRGDHAGATILHERVAALWRSINGAALNEAGIRAMGKLA